MTEVSIDLDADDSSLESLPSHRTEWKQHDLLATILRRYFYVASHMSGGFLPTWVVSPKEGKDIDESLKQANTYLHKLGWAAKLSRTEEWIVQLIPLPERQFPSRNLTLIMWMVSALTLTLAGAYWMEGSRPTGGWFADSTFVDAVFGYTFPVLLCIFIASIIQKRTAAHFNHRVGHITPIPEPAISLWSLGLFSQSALIWPFGLFLIPTLPRMDARLWEDRKVLGWVAMSVPAALILLGLALWGLGLWLTPEYVVVTQAQNMAQGPFLVEVLGQWLVDDYVNRLIWSHPFVKAGALLTFFGWVSLLPIPTFPGGRIMVARAGHMEARSGSNQMFLFLIILAFAWMFNAFNGFTIWMLVLTLILPLLLIMGADRTSPVLLNEPKGLDLQSMKNIGIVMLVAVLFALPSQVPFERDDDWNADVDFGIQSVFSAERLDDRWNAKISIHIVNPSSVNRDWAIDYDQFADGLENWAKVWECDGEDALSINGFGCGSVLAPRTHATVVLNLTWTDLAHSPRLTNFSLLTLADGDYDSHTVSVHPDLLVYPQSQWEMLVFEGELMRCMTLLSFSDEQLNITFPNADQSLDIQSRLQWIQGESGLEAQYDSAPGQVCLRGLDPVVLRTSELNTIQLNDDMFDGGLPDLPMIAVVPASGWNINSTDSLGWGFELDSSGILSSVDAPCPLNPSLSIPPSPAEGEWIWDLDVRTISNIPSVNNVNQSLTVQMTDGASMHVCSPSLTVEPKFNFTVEEGPELVFQRYNTSHRMWSNMWMAAYNGTLLQPDGSSFSFYSSANASIPVQINYQGNGEQWSTSQSVNSLSKGWNTFEFTPSDSTLSTLWFEHQDGSIVIHLASYV